MSGFSTQIKGVHVLDLKSLPKNRQETVSGSESFQVELSTSIEMYRHGKNWAVDP